MKSLVKRLICFVVAFAICITFIPQIAKVLANGEEPRISSNCETVIYEALKEGSFGTGIKGLRTNTTVKLSANINLTSADVFEFDVYIENINILNAIITETQKVWFCFSSNAAVATSNYAYADISAQLTENGWNHVRVEKSAFQESNIKWDRVRQVYLRFADESTSAYFPNNLKDKVVEIKNVCDVLDILKNKDSDLVIYEDAIFNSLGNSEDSLVADIANRFSDELAEKDISKAKIIKADFYISDYKAYTQFLNQNKIRVTFLSENGEKYTESVGKYIVAKQFGWYTISFLVDEMTTIGEFDSTKVTGFKVGFVGLDGATLGSAYSLKLAVSNIRGFESEILASAIISEEGKSGIYGNTYSDIAVNSEIKLDSPVDASVARNIAFDFYVEDFDEFKAMLEASSTPLYFVLGTSQDKANAYALYEFTDQVKGNGWNHIEFEVEGYTATVGTIDIKTVYYAHLSFGSETAANTYADLPFNIADICVIASDIDVNPQLPKNYTPISLDGVTETWGKQYNWTIDRLFVDLTENPLYLEDVDRFQFDIYIEDYYAFKEAVKGKRINFALSNSDNRTKTRIRFDFENQITHSGWNHISLEKGSRWLCDTGFDYHEVKWIMIYFQDGKSEDNPISDTKVRVANIIGSNDEHYYLPELPENVIAQLGVAENDPEGSDNRGNTAGNYFHYTLDKIYREKLTPVDFSKSNIIEFDVYVSDYEKMLAAENDPTDGQNSKLSFVLSSTVPGLWEQYSKPRVYYSSEIDIAPYIKHSGWNHIKIGRSEFKTKNHGVDWSALTAFMVYYRNSSNLYPYKNQNSDLYIKVANIVNTGVVANIPVDKEAELQPDKDAVYISSIEGLSDNNGVWNVDNPIMSTDYKTAGKSSIHKKVNYSSELVDTVMGYIFDSTVDMSDLKTLKFDFFIDLPQYLNKPTNSIEIIVANNRFGKDDYYSCNMDLTNLKQGWNEITLDFENADVVGKPDLKNVKLIMLRFTEIGLTIDNFEEIVFGIDNLRYISSTGNKILKVDGWDSGETTIPEEETPSQDTTPEQDEIPKLETNDVLIDFENETEVVEKVVNKKGKTKINKTIEKTYVADYLTSGIVLGIEAVVLAIGVAVFIIIYRRKNKKSI